MEDTGRLREALLVAAEALEIVADWNVDDIQLDTPPEWELSSCYEEGEISWCDVGTLAKKLREIALSVE